MPDIETSKLIENTFDLWSYIKINGGLDLERYDSYIVEELISILAYSKESDFDAQLRESDISIEDFLAAFFQIVHPYSEMMVDLLHLFKKAGINTTNRNATIDFKFNTGRVFNFDINNFKKWVRSWKTISGKYKKVVIDESNLWDLLKIFNTCHMKIHDIVYELNDKKIIEWIHIYNSKQQWPDLIPQPFSGSAVLDKLIGRAWKIWTTIVSKSSSYNVDRRKLWDKSNISSDICNDSTSREISEYDVWIELLSRIDKDNWAGNFAASVYYMVQQINKLNSNEKEDTIKVLERKLISVLKKIQDIDYSNETVVEELKAFLNLPVWKKRYELYATWISTQIIDAFSELKVRIHQSGGVLKFSFSGTHLATIDDYTPRLHIWSELRTPMKNPIGKSRKRGIQPDYSLVTDPVTSPQSSVVVIECKQYLKASSDNFSKALTDYAKGRPNAHIILVNYGRADTSILDKVDPLVVSRTSIIGEMKPGSTGTIYEFKELIRNKVKEKYI